MPTPNLVEAVAAMRSYHAVLRASPPNPNLLSSWIQRQTNDEIVSDFCSDAAISVLHYYQHPLYGDPANLPSSAAGWISLMTTAEGILQSEEIWIDDQLQIANITRPVRLFDSDINWLRQWATSNGIPTTVETAYLLNALIIALQQCEGNNGPTGAGGISHTTYNPPNLPPEEIV